MKQKNKIKPNPPTYILFLKFKTGFILDHINKLKGLCDILLPNERSDFLLTMHC